MPTTASSAASVTSPLRACTCREIGITRWAKRQATNAISGVATPVYSVSRGLIDASTMAPPTIIMALCTPCTTPQPMKYRIGNRSLVARETTWPVGCRSKNARGNRR